MSKFIEDELDDLVKASETFKFDKLEPYKQPEQKFAPYPSVNISQLRDYLADSKLKAKLKQLGADTSVSSSGGYNDFYLKFLQDSFDIKIKKTPEFFSYVVRAIDFLNTTIEDCFFDYPAVKDSGPINFAGKRNSV